MWQMSILLPVLFLGGVAGFIAGLLGVGGGLIIVPIMIWLLGVLGIHDNVQHVAVGTSMAVMVFTNFSSVMAQNKKKAVRWDIVFRFAPWMILGVMVGSVIAKFLPSHGLQIFFVVFVLTIAIQTIFDLKPKGARGFPEQLGTSIVGSIIGCLSSWVGIGGASMSIPFMLYCNLPMINAVGTSAALGWPIALSGAIGYIVTGWAYTDLEHGMLGFVFLPGMIALAIGTVSCAPLGVKVAHKLPTRALKLAFATMLLITAAQMVYKMWFSA
jgi:uncharacterized membrane protein YfcA